MTTYSIDIQIEVESDRGVEAIMGGAKEALLAAFLSERHEARIGIQVPAETWSRAGQSLSCYAHEVES